MIASMEIVNEPVIAESPRRHVLYRHHVVTEADLAQTFGSTFSDLYERVAQAGLVSAGPPFVIYHDDSEPGVRWNMDVCAPVSSAASPTFDIDYMVLPATHVVSLLHIGPYETLGSAYSRIASFIAERGLTISGPAREFYLSPPETPPDQIQTIVERPVEQPPG